VHPGATFDPRDEAAIARALTRVLEDREFSDEIARRGLERARTLTWGAVAERTVAAYGEVVERRARRLARRPRSAGMTLITWSPPEAGSPSAALVALAVAVSRRQRVHLGVPGPLVPHPPGLRLIAPERPVGAPTWLEGPVACLVDSPATARQAARVLGERRGVAILWELDPVLGRPGNGVPQAALAELAAAADRLLVTSDLDAWRLRSALGSRTAPTPEVLAQPLVWSGWPAATMGPPPHAALMLGPGRREVLRERRVRLLAAVRPPRLGPFGEDEVARHAALAVALTAHRPERRIVLLGRVSRRMEEEPPAAVREQRAAGRLVLAGWPGHADLVAWLTAADAVLDLSLDSHSAARAARDYALHVGRPSLALAPPDGRPARTSAGATPGELAAVVAALEPGVPDALTEAEARARDPGRVAGRLLALAEPATRAVGAPAL
jgi:hypothetical protein